MGRILQEIFSNYTASISDLQINPRFIWEKNEPVGYCIPHDLCLKILEALEDTVLINIIRGRKDDEEIEVLLDEL